jgi:hypothetical protein
LADVAHRIVLEALGRAAARPDGLPLFAAEPGAGLFAATATGKQAARRCRDDGLLRVVRGKDPRQVCAITDKGLAFLIGQADPRTALEVLVEAVRAREAQLDEIAGHVRREQEQFADLASAARAALDRLAGGRPAEPDHPPELSADAVREQLAGWHASAALGDCPLPELFRRLRPVLPRLTIGQFHDRLRRMHQEQAVYLHPWTGPLYQMPEPSLALLVGHEIAYYASLRDAPGSANGAARGGPFRERNDP